MNALWTRLSGKFAALSLRERALVAGAILAAVVFGGYTLFVAPAQARQAAYERQLAQQAEERAKLAEQSAALAAQGAGPDAANRARLDELKRGLADADARLRALSGALVPAEDVSALLQAMLVRQQGLKLKSLRALPPGPLAAEPSAEGQAGDAGLYRRAVEITVEGSYADLTAYAVALESLPQKLFWVRARLVAGTWPASTLTLTVFTLSPEATWLRV